MTTLFPINEFLIIICEPIVQFLPILTFCSIIVLLPISDDLPILTFFPIKTLLPNFTPGNLDLFGFFNEISG